MCSSFVSSTVALLFLCTPLRSIAGRGEMNPETVGSSTASCCAAAALAPGGVQAFAEGVEAVGSGAGGGHWGVRVGLALDDHVNKKGTDVEYDHLPSEGVALFRCCCIS